MAIIDFNPLGIEVRFDSAGLQDRKARQEAIAAAEQYLESNNIRRFKSNRGGSSNPAYYGIILEDRLITYGELFPAVGPLLPFGDVTFHSLDAYSFEIGEFNRRGFRSTDGSLGFQIRQSAGDIPDAIVEQLRSIMSGDGDTEVGVDQRTEGPGSHLQVQRFGSSLTYQQYHTALGLVSPYTEPFQNASLESIQ